MTTVHDIIRKKGSEDWSTVSKTTAYEALQIERFITGGGR